MSTSFLQPIAPVRVPLPPLGREYVHELKWDGFRGLTVTGSDPPIIYSKRLHPLSRFAGLARTVHEAVRGRAAVLDGEVVCLEANGRPNFAALMSRRATPVYMAFDMLMLDAVDLRGLPLDERKRRLRRLLRDSQAVRYVPHARTSGRAFFDAARRLDLEGIVSKPAGSPYVCEPSPWRKTLNPAYTQKTERRFELFGRP